MDEPFSGLDPAALDEVVKLLVQVRDMDELNTLFIVTHDIRTALAVADTVLMLGRNRTPTARSPRAPTSRKRSIWSSSGSPIAMIWRAIRSSSSSNGA